MMRRSKLLSVAPVLLLLLGCTGIGVVYNRAHARASRPPTVEWLREHLYEGEVEILGYSTANGVPRVAYGHKPGSWLGDGLIHFVRLGLDPYGKPWLLPVWQVIGQVYSIPESVDPVSVGVARCAGDYGEHCQASTKLYGQVRDPRIAAVDVLYEGTWHRYPASTPGFVIELDGFNSTPIAYRWLDGDGAVVWFS